MFSDKFHLLNSQEHLDDDIKWSSSSSEQDEKYTSSIIYKTQHRKRKRSKTAPKNASNLKVVIVDTTKDTKCESTAAQSPILSSKIMKKSPILSSRHTVRNGDHNSPVLNGQFSQKSPVIQLKYASPKPSVKVRKKLFCAEKKWRNMQTDCCDKYCDNQSVDIFNYSTSILHQYTTDCLSSNNKLKGKNTQLLNKSEHRFIDSNFSSDSASQYINETPTPDDSSKSDDIEILSCKTQDIENKCIEGTSRNQSDTSFTDTETNSKKVKYKKGGLASRLNILLKKHNANISLWQHERFLATNSNFVIPKGDHLVFYIKKIVYKYGCYVLETMNKNDEKYLILINNIYVKCNLISDCILKLYEPFRILDNNENCKLIINVCKFEIVDFKKDLLK